MTTPKPPLVRPDPEYRERLAVLAAWHHTWATRYADRATFTPRGPDSDYNQHELDVDPDVAVEDIFHRKARKIMGIG